MGLRGISVVVVFASLCMLAASQEDDEDAYQMDLADRDGSLLLLKRKQLTNYRAGRPNALALYRASRRLCANECENDEDCSVISVVGSPAAAAGGKPVPAAEGGLTAKCEAQVIDRYCARKYCKSLK